MGLGRCKRPGLCRNEDSAAGASSPRAGQVAGCCAWCGPAPCTAGGRSGAFTSERCCFCWGPGSSRTTYATIGGLWPRWQPHSCRHAPAKARCGCPQTATTSEDCSCTPLQSGSSFSLRNERTSAYAACAQAKASSTRHFLTALGLQPSDEPDGATYKLRESSALGARGTADAVWALAMLGEELLFLDEMDALLQVFTLLRPCPVSAVL